MALQSRLGLLPQQRVRVGCSRAPHPCIAGAPVKGDFHIRPLRQFRVDKTCEGGPGNAGVQDTSSAGEASADFAKSDRPLPRTGTGG